jgi:teichuronic acid biosynthesis glycosyltransferase TuaC
MKVLMVTSEWPDKFNPQAAPFVRSQYEKLKNRNVEVDLIHLRGNKKIRNYIKNFFLIKRVIRNNNYDLLHAQWGQSALPLIFFSQPLIITYRGDDIEGIIGKNGRKGIESIILKSLGKFVSLFASHIIVVSEHMIKKLGTNKKYTVIPSGINFHALPAITKDQARIELQIPKDKIIFLFPNNVEVIRKNFKLAKMAFDFLPNEVKAKSEIKVVNGLKHSELLKYMIASDFLLFTSFHEGSPNVVKEAIACNLPVISVDVADVKKRIGEIPGCFVCSSYDPIQFSKTISLALKFNYQNYYSKAFVLELDEDLLIQKLIEIYKSLNIK